MNVLLVLAIRDGEKLYSSRSRKKIKEKKLNLLVALKSLHSLPDTDDFVQSFPIQTFSCYRTAGGCLRQILFHFNLNQPDICKQK